jgi:hypothetical protein
MMGLAKTCMKLKLSFYDFLGAHIGLPGTPIPPSPNLSVRFHPEPKPKGFI